MKSSVKRDRRVLGRSLGSLDIEGIEGRDGGGGGGS